MKVVSPNQMSNIESQAYQGGSSEYDFMEEAGSGVALVAHEYAELHNLDRIAILLCGKGNNAGDAYVAGSHLLHLDYEVYAIQIHPIDDCSPLCKQNYQHFLTEGGHIADITHPFPRNGIIIDGLFGTGFHGEVKEPYASLIRRANASTLPIIAVDIPSGLNGETGQITQDVIVATETAYLCLPKSGFFLQQGWNHVGKLRYVDFGLPKSYIDNCTTDMVMSTVDLIKPLLPKIIRNRHKYEAGFVVGLAGSPGMPGASMLASTAALRGGAGIVKLLHPDNMQVELAATPYEIIKVPYTYDHLDPVIHLMNQASATFIGPGIGRSPDAHTMLKTILPQLQKPCVIDADALTILSEENISLPKKSILTPHLGELMRLMKITDKPDITQKFLTTCQNYAEDLNITLILKGGPSFIFHPQQPIRINPTGDPGMATAGSGDVLTGLIASFLAQGLPTNDAAYLATFLHGLAGEFAAEEMTSYGVIASDIIYHFPEAFRFYTL